MLVPTLRKSGRCEMSVFGSKPASLQQIGVAVTKLAVAFPNMSDEFFDLLTERITKRGFSVDRLEYATDYTLDNFTYRNLTIGDFMSIDKKVVVMSYSEMLAECSKRGCTTDEFASIHIGDEPKPFWVHRSDKARYNLPDRL